MVESQNNKSGIISFMFFLLLFLYFHSFAQKTETENIDIKVSSLLKIKPDSIKIDSLVEYGRELRYKYPEKAIEIFNECIKLSEHNGFPDRVVDNLIQISATFIIHTYWDSAHYYVDKSIYIADSLQLNFLLAKAYRIKAIIFQRSGYINSSINYLKKSINILGSKDSNLLSNIYNTLGLTYSDLCEYDSATFYYLKSFNLLDSIKKRSLGYIQLINLSDVLTKQGDYYKAKEFLNESLDLLQNRNDNSSIQNKSLVFTKLGSIYFAEEKYDSSLNCFRLSEKYYKRIGLNLANTFLNIGGVYGEIGKTDSALYYYSLVKKELINRPEDKVLGMVYNNIALLYMNQGKYDLALKNLDSAIYIEAKAGVEAKLITYYENKYLIYEELSDYKNAFKYLLKIKTLSDSIFNIQKTKLISDLEMKYEKEKDQAHILSLKNENLQKNLELNRRTNQRNIFLAGGSGILVISILIFAFYRQRVKKDKIIADQRIEKLEREKKLLAAKSIVEGQEEERKRIARELHDGLGVLLSTAKMQFKTIEDKSPGNSEMIKKAAGLLEKASSDVRRISHNMMPGILTKLGLDEAIEDLFDNINDTPGITAILNITNEEEKRLPENTEIMIYRMVQEMVNNTLKYAGADKVTLDLIYEEETVSLQYSDNGKGFDVEEKLKNKSIGLTSIQSRVNFLGGKLNINSRPGRGTTFFISIGI